MSKSANLWWSGPEWLIHEERWPSNITTSDTNETRAEIKAVKEILAVAIPVEDELDQLLEKHDF